MKKILFTDLDATLLNDKKEITEKNREAIEKMLMQGNSIVLASGRSLPSVLIQAEKLGLDKEGCFICAYNGGQVYNIFQKEMIYECGIPKEITSRLFEEAKKYGIHIQAYDDSDVICSAETPEILLYCSQCKVNFRTVEDVSKELDVETKKMIVSDLHDQEHIEGFRKIILELYGDQLDTYYSCKEYLEVVMHGVNKGQALELLCNKLNIPVEDAVAAGDAENDKTMIVAAGTGCAMANAEEEVKAIADYITVHDCNHDGVAEIIEKFILD